MTPVAAAVLGILRTKGARFIGGPIGGITADRLGSAGKVIIGSNVVMIILLLLFFVVPNAGANAVFAVTLSMLVPTNVDINLNFQFHTNARCFNLADCALSADASHSDYMGIALDSGYSFTSANGYQYLGVPAAIPEPSTVLLMLAGLVAMGGVVRRRAA